MSGVGGLVIGSFLNVALYRLPRGLSLVQPPSQCPACDARLTAIDMVPVFSWIVLRARCRHCGDRISARYPLVELATGVVFAGMAAALGSLWPLPSADVVGACVLLAALVDAEGNELPRFVAPIAALAALSLAVVALALGQEPRIGWEALGAALSAGAAFAADRSGGIQRYRRIIILTVLGAAAGWLWAGGGPFAAAWIVVATAATVVGATRRPPLAVLIAGSFLAVIGSAVIGRP